MGADCQENGELLPARATKATAQRRLHWQWPSPSPPSDGVTRAVTAVTSPAKYRTRSNRCVPVVDDGAAGGGDHGHQPADGAGLERPAGQGVGRVEGAADD